MNNWAGYTAIHRKIQDVLVKYGIDLNRRIDAAEWKARGFSATDMTPLHQAILESDLNAVQTLLGLGADPNQGSPAASPLHRALGWAPCHDSRERRGGKEFEPSLDIVRALVEAGADPNIRDCSNDIKSTPKEIAERAGRHDLLNIMRNCQRQTKEEKLR